MVALAIGSDTGGSCRVPAAFNGIVGYKSSWGRVPTRGAYPLSATFDTIGPLANSVRCCASVDALMSEDWDGQLVERRAEDLRLGIVKDLFFDDIEPQVAEAFDRARTKMSKAGVTFCDVSFPELQELPQINANGGIVAVEAFTHHAGMIASSGAAYDQRVRKRIESGSLVSAPELLRIQTRRADLMTKCDRLMSGLDGWFVPTTANIPPAVSAFDTFENYGRLNFLCLRNTFVGNFLTRCAISLPLNLRGEVPVGGMIMAPFGADHALFGVAACVENIL